MDEIYVVVAGLFLVPVLALLVTWKKPLAAARKQILLMEVVGLVLYILAYAQVDLFGWQLRYWGSVSLLELISYWLSDQGHALPWVIPALVETGLVLVIRQGVQHLRKRARMARFHAIVGPGKDGAEP